MEKLFKLKNKIALTLTLGLIGIFAGDYVLNKKNVERLSENREAFAGRLDKSQIEEIIKSESEKLNLKNVKIRFDINNDSTPIADGLGVYRTQEHLDSFKSYCSVSEEGKETYTLHFSEGNVSPASVRWGLMNVKYRMSKSTSGAKIVPIIGRIIEERCIDYALEKSKDF